MHEQLATIADQLTAAADNARKLVAGLDETAFQKRPDPPGWSVAECLTHLNLMDEAMLPRLDAAISRGQASGADPARRYRRDLIGWLLSWSLEPPSRMRSKTTPPFVPGSTGTRDAVLSRFVKLKGDLRSRLEAASGLDLNGLRVQSPLSDKLFYNVYSAFRIIAAHERRHLRQAERVATSIAPRNSATGR